MASIARLADGGTWAHPLVRDAADPDLRADIMALWSVAQQLAGLLDSLPRTFAHGHACPQNLLAGARPGSFVAIDWGMTGTGVIGTDLGQLVAGGWSPARSG